MPRTQQCLQAGRRLAQIGDFDSVMAHHWKLLKRLAATPKGYTVQELVQATGVSVKTVRRDLVLLQKLGYDLEETVEKFGRKRWRVRRLVRKSRPSRQHYRSIQALLDTAIVQAQAVGDLRLARTLTAARNRVSAR